MSAFVCLMDTERGCRCSFSAQPATPAAVVVAPVHVVPADVVAAPASVALGVVVVEARSVPSEDLSEVVYFRFSPQLSPARS